MKDDNYSENTTHNAHNTHEKEENSPVNKEEEYEQGKHPNSLKTLKKYQFTKGVSGNPLGARKTFNALKKNLCELADNKVENRNGEIVGTRKEQVLKRIWEDAQKGDMKKIQLLAWLGALD